MDARMLKFSMAVEYFPSMMACLPLKKNTLVSYWADASVTNIENDRITIAAIFLRSSTLKFFPSDAASWPKFYNFDRPEKDRRQI